MDTETPGEVGPAPRPPRARNPAATTRDILVAARQEFVEHGLDGARVDRIAERAGANKRLLYHYVGNKEALYARVMLDAYREIRLGEAALHLSELPPAQAMARLVEFTFDHFHSHPWFIRLLAIENFNRAATIRGIPEIREQNSPIITQLHEVLASGVALGVFRSGVDPVHLYLTIAGISYFYFSNLHTLSVVFDTALNSPEHRAARRAHAVEVVLAYLAAPS